MGELEHRGGGKRLDSFISERGDQEEELDEYDMTDEDSLEPIEPKVPSKSLDREFWTYPWLGWCFTCTLAVVFFFVYRYTNLDAMIGMYGDATSKTFRVKAQVILLGCMEDFVCTTYFVFTLWGFDWAKKILKKRFKYQGGRGHANFQRQKRLARLGSQFATFVVSWFLVIAMMIPVVCDMLLIRYRELRFTLEAFLFAYNELAFINEAPISKEEFHAGYLQLFIMVVGATFIATVRTKARWADLSKWNPMHSVASFAASQISRLVPDLIQNNGQSYAKVELNDNDSNQPVMRKTLDTISDTKPSNTVNRNSLFATFFVISIAFPLFVVGSSRSSSVLVASSALNMTLNQLFMQALLPQREVNKRGDDGDRGRPWAETYIHYQTEEHKLFGKNSLYRRTTGFRGDLAFDVNVDNNDPPNVILIALEAARFHNSRYLVGDDDPSNLFNGSKFTIVPAFDKWAKRGVSFSNMWSSYPSSRCLESALFAQIPYHREDNAVKTAIAGGRIGTKLFGMPQLFSAKGYENSFMTGSTITYDAWDKFLPAHGFDTVLSVSAVTALAESNLGISPADWNNLEGRRNAWGVHDDISFQLLGDLMVNKTKEQSERMARGEPKKPIFHMQYTISSHEPFFDRPKWYADMEKPDFSSIHAGLDRSEEIKNYLEMQYFVDMEMGKFMDRMEQEGILNNTIVVIFGDHGRGVENVNHNSRPLSSTRVPAAIIAEGRLEKYAGLMIDDATEHYDLLNTLADITGLPDGGFLQHGVGRSLKRKIPFGERVVFSNNPFWKMAVVRGHQRLQYDYKYDSVLLHNTYTDHDMHVNLFPNLTVEEQTEWLAWRDIGRDLALYTLQRWDGNCILAVNCSER